jgi:hypothetical protein
VRLLCCDGATGRKASGVFACQSVWLEAESSCQGVAVVFGDPDGQWVGGGEAAVEQELGRTTLMCLLRKSRFYGTGAYRRCMYIG